MIRPHVVRVWQPDVFVEAVLQRQKRPTMPQMPLAEDRGRVPAALAQLAERDFVGVDALTNLRIERAQNAHPLGITPREQRGPRGRADRRGRVEIGEDATFL